MTVIRARQPYGYGSIVLVDFVAGSGNKRGLPQLCIVVTYLLLRTDGWRIPTYPVVPLVSAELHFGSLTPRLLAREDGLPINATAAIPYVRTVAASRVVGYIGRLNDTEYLPIRQGLIALFGIL